MGTPFSLVVRSEHQATSSKTTLWGAIRVDPVGKALESDRAPLAIVLVVDVSPSMAGDPIAHALQSCELLCDLLDQRDRLAIVTFSDHAGVRCGLTSTDDVGRADLKKTLIAVPLGSGTNIHAGMEVGAGVLMTAPVGLRRVMVVLSDGQPNSGLSSAEQLATYTRGLGLAVSTLGFGLHHDENVLGAIAAAGSGRYAYIPDPLVARVDMARAALAHGGVVAAQLELKIKLLEGVELLRLVPTSPLRHGGSGVVTTLGDVFVDEGRLVAFELELDLPPSSRGRLAEITVKGQAADGSVHQCTADLVIDVRTGTPVPDREAQRDIVTVQANAARAEARAQADRRAYPAAGAILRQVVARIDAIEGFVADDGSVLAELREQLVDEAASYEHTATDAERNHRRKANMAYNYATPASTPQAAREPAPVAARVVGIGGPVVGKILALALETTFGRTHGSDMVIPHGSCSRRHTRILFTDDRFVLVDLGSTNGTVVDGQPITSHTLCDGDRFKIGEAEFLFELK
ncbi:MAG: VWA domain-containing protein [Deltaproteobacteria bacterium]|nr:VWA domain-containing protein [Deltaproteobacteria bacterium]